MKAGSLVIFKTTIALYLCKHGPGPHKCATKVNEINLKIMFQIRYVKMKEIKSKPDQTNEINSETIWWWIFITN